MKALRSDAPNDRFDDDSFKFRALSAGAVMTFDGQTDSNLPSKHYYLILNDCRNSQSLNGVHVLDTGERVKPTAFPLAIEMSGTKTVHEFLSRVES
jgi:hypothetical protein